MDSVYKFKVGQRVSMSAIQFETAPHAGTFKIVALLPLENGERQYRVKHDQEAFERRVGEGRLSPAS